METTTDAPPAPAPRDYALELLRGTRNVLTVQGWRQHAYGRDAEGYSIYGAMMRAALVGGTPTEDIRFAKEMLEFVVGYSPELFNDEPGRKRKDVLAVVEHAIGLVEQ